MKQSKLEQNKPAPNMSDLNNNNTPVQSNPDNSTSNTKINTTTTATTATPTPKTSTTNYNNSSTSSNPTTTPRLTQQQLLELTNKFKELVTEAKRVGETTQRGKELLIQASKIKNIYDNYTRAIRQRQEIQKSNMVVNSSSSPPPASASVSTSSASSLSTNNNITGHINTGTPASTANTPTSNTNTPTSSSNNNNNNQFSMLMRQALTPEQNQQYEKLSIDFQTRARNIRDKHNFIKQNIDTLTQEINKLTDLDTKKQLVEKRSELLNTLRQLSQEHNNLRIQFQTGRKNFYIECAKNNPDLQRVLQRSSQQASYLTQAQSATIPPPQQQVQNQTVPKQDVVSQPNVETRNETANDSKQHETQTQGQIQSPAQSNSGIEVQNTTTTITSPPKNNITTNTNTNAQTAPTNDQNNTSTINNTSTTKNNKTNNNISAQVTNVNATAATNVSYPTTKQKIFKTSEPNIPITENLSVKQPNSITYKINRPTMTGGSAMNASSLNTPVVTKIPPYEIDTERVMSKRKLRELVKSVGVDEGDGETVIDGDVEELLLDLADDFVTNVTSFACRLAKHRRSDNLNVKDIQLHLERNWNIRIPGYSADEIRSIRKWNPSTVYNQKLQAVNTERNHKGQISSGKITKK